MERKDIAQELKWRVTDIFPSDEAWEKEFKDMQEPYNDYDFSVFKGKLGNKEDLLACFQLNDTISRRIEKLYLYAHLCYDVDMRVGKYASANAQVGAFISKIFAEFSPR